MKPFKVKVYDLEAKALAPIEVKTNLFIDKVNNQAMFDAIICENASVRQGTHSTLKKGEVSGTGKKPFRQKHTGRARSGSLRNPQYVGGGVAFGPKPNRNYEVKLNKKVAKLAFSSAFTLKAKAHAFIGLDFKKLAKPKTSKFSEFLNNIKLNDKKVLFVFNKKQNTAFKSVRNINKVIAKEWNSVSTKDLLHTEYVIVEKNVFKTIEGVK